jgi:hypothetical protein
MSAPNDVYQEMTQSLMELEEACLRILKDLGEFENYAGSYADNRILRQLVILGHWIIDLTKSLYEEHQGKGYVCVFLSKQNGLKAYWVEDRETVADKSWYASCGSTVLSPEEVIDIVCRFIEDLRSNNWVTVVEWLKIYGKSPGLNFSKFP